MKLFLNLCSVASMLGFFAIAASDLGLPVPVAVVKKTEGSSNKVAGRAAPKASFSAPVVFNSHTRSKVIQYFDTYRSEPFGLPPACAASGEVGRMLAEEDNNNIAVGKVIPENSRVNLIEVPLELVRVLTVQSEVEVHYYLAGSKLIAIDAQNKVVDLVAIPTVKSSDAEMLQLVGIGTPRLKFTR